MATNFTQVATEAEVERPSVSKLRGIFAESRFVDGKTVSLIVGPRKLPQNKIHKRRLQETMTPIGFQLDPYWIPLGFPWISKDFYGLQ